MITHSDHQVSPLSSEPTIGSQTEIPLQEPVDPSPSPPSLICRRPVRVVIYCGLGAFFLWMLAWGLIPPLLDPTGEQHIKENRVMVGMTREQVMEAWGSPYQMNVSYTSKGIRREEWVYEDWIDTATISHRYLYFEEGQLVGGWY